MVRAPTPNPEEEPAEQERAAEEPGRSALGLRRDPRSPGEPGDQRHPGGDADGEMIGHEARERPGQDPQAHEQQPGGQAQGDRRPAAGHERDDRANLREPVPELVDDQRDVAEDDHADRREAGAPEASARGRVTGSTQVDDVQGEQRRGEGDPEDVALDSDDEPGRGDDPPACAPCPVRTPGAGQGDRRRQGNEVRVPDPGRFRDRACRDGHQQAGHEARDRTADRARQPPGDANRGHAGDRNRPGDHDRVVTGDPGERGEQEVVQDAVVEVADRGGRADERNDMVVDEPPQDEHLGALVGVPAGPAVESGQSQERGNEKHAAEDDEILA